MRVSSSSPIAGGGLSLARSLLAACVLAGGAFAPRAGAQSLEATLVPADAMSTQLFGQSVSLEGELAVVGATGDASNAGAAYVFRRTLGVWGEELKLEPVDLEATDLFGASTALDGDLAAVGAPDALDVFGGGNPGSGAVYLFRDDAGAWTQQARIVALDAANFDQLGRAVAVQGDLLVAGAPGDLEVGDGDPDGGEGAVYVFRYDGVSWAQEDKLLATHAGPDHRLGESVAVDGDLIVAGAPGFDNSGTDSGSAIVFRFVSGAWFLEQRLLPDDPAAGDAFGSAVAVDGDLVAVGAPRDNQGFSDTGAIYLFRFDGLEWVQEAKLVASDATANGQLGTSLSLQAPMLLSGAPGASAGDGKGYLFADVGASWIEHSQLADGASLSNGRGVALDGTQVLLGAPWTTSGSLLFAGSAYVFEAFTDCNANALPDDTDIALGSSLDCNLNDVPDECDIAGGASEDCDGNDVPDECDPDLNRNEIPDACEGVWTNLGNALAGTNGEPLFEGEGTLIPNDGVTLTLSNALPSSTTTLLVGLSALFAPFKGGVLVPNPTIMIFGLPTGPAGLLPLTAHWPAGLPPSFTLYFQHWIIDPGGPAGLAASNGLSATTPP